LHGRLNFHHQTIYCSWQHGVFHLLACCRINAQLIRYRCQGFGNQWTKHILNSDLNCISTPFRRRNNERSSTILCWLGNFVSY
jgi:hypothetical protein